MNKNELIEVIQQVITPNGQKGITAESLANLLIEMVNATPEGGSGGSGQVVFYMGMPNEDFTSFTLTPEQQAHNAEIFKVIKESKFSLCASLDAADYFASMSLGEGIDAKGYKFCFSCVTTIYAPENIAPSLGLPSDLISIESEFASIIVYPDGSVTLME